MLDELLVGLGFDFDPEDIEKFNSELDKGLNLIKTFSTAMVAGTAALVGFSTAVTSAVDKQGKLSEETDIAIGTIDALAFSLSRVGGDSNSLEGDIRSLSIAVSEASRGVGSAVEAFGILGISSTDAQGNLRPTVDVLMEVADAIQGLPRSQQYELVNKVGLGNSIRLLQQGSEGIRELIGEANALGLATEEDAAISAEFQDSLTNLSQIGKQFSRLLSRELTPILESVTNTIEDWWKQNRTLIEQKLPEYIESITKGLKLLTLASAIFIGGKLISSVFALAKAFKAVQLSALLANAAIFAIPALIFSIISAIALLSEDANVFFQGGKSFIGDMIQKYPEWAEQIRTVAAIFATIYDMTMMIFDGWSMIIDLFSTDLNTHVEAFKLIFQDIKNYVLGMFDDIVNSINSFISDIGNSIEQSFKDAIDSIETMFDNLWSSIKRKFKDNVTSPIKETFDNFTSFLGFSNEDENNQNISETSTFENISNFIVSKLPDLNSESVQNVTSEFTPKFESENTIDIKSVRDLIPEIFVEPTPVNIGGTNIEPTPVDFSGIEDYLPEIFVENEIPGLEILSMFSKDINPETGSYISNSNSIDKSDNSKTSSNSVSISLGGITVPISSSGDIDRGQARNIARNIYEELEPIFKQASIDLNSSVEL